MACPHCQQTVLVQPKAEPTAKQKAKSSAAIASPPAKATPEPKTKPPVTAKQKPDPPPKPTQPSGGALDAQSGGLASVEPPPISQVAATGAGTAVAPSNETEQAKQIDEPAEVPVVEFVPQPVDHLLPPKFSAVDPAFFYRRHQDGSQVLLPSEDGSLKVVDNRIVRIKHNGKVYELISSPQYDRMQKSIVNNLLAVIICGLLIAIVMTLLNG